MMKKLFKKLSNKGWSMATMVESGVECIDVIDRRLTLDGLQMLHEKNKGLNKKRVLQD